MSSQSPHGLYSPAETVLTCVVPRALRQHLCRFVVACDACRLEDTLSHVTCGCCECALRMRILSLCVRAFSLPCGAVREGAPHRAIVHELLDQVDGRVVLRGRDTSIQIRSNDVNSDQIKRSIRYISLQVVSSTARCEVGVGAAAAWHGGVQGRGEGGAFGVSARLVLKWMKVEAF